MIHFEWAAGDPKIITVDFDGVICTPDAPFKDVALVEGTLTPGCAEFLRDLVRIATVCIFSSRSKEAVGITAMKAWLYKQLITALGASVDRWFAAIEWPTDKPPAYNALDDRTTRFTGLFPSPQSMIDTPAWWEK